MKQNKLMFITVIVVILAAALSRIAFYPLNFSPVIAMALFGGAMIKDKRFAFALPLLAMFLSDLMFEISGIAPGFWGWGQLAGYVIFAAITVLGFSLKKPGVFSITGYSIAASLLFFFLSNSSVWLFEPAVYARSFTGYMNCLAAGIPFLKNGLVADLFYSGVFFGGYMLIERFTVKNAIA